jgi:enoyl-[acyl-carrier protein] reductase I
VYRDRAPLRRNIETGEVGETAAFLLSDAARGITGEVLMVDAGFHIMGM